jgi:hypothetical protein
MLHFSATDLRVRLATTLFTDNGDGDFINPAAINPCPCDHTATTALIRRHWRDEARAGNQNPHFENCPWHNCCVIWEQVIPCQWYWDNQDVLGEDPAGVEEHCPNRFVVSEYRPITMLFEKGEDAEVSGMEMQSGWTSCEVPVFPAGDLLYSDEIFEASATDVESYGLYVDRAEVQRLGEELWNDKLFLKRAIECAQQALDELEREFREDAVLKLFAKQPMKFMPRFRVARNYVKEVQGAERDAADSFRRMMKHAGFVLGALGTMPRPGESLTTPDGSYSVSREQLDLGQLDREAVIDACDGRLKQAAVLAKRLRSVKAILRVPKRVRNRHARRTKYPRDAPIPACFKFGRKSRCSEAGR